MALQNTQKHKKHMTAHSSTEHTKVKKKTQQLENTKLQNPE